MPSIMHRGIGNSECEGPSQAPLPYLLSTRNAAAKQKSGLAPKAAKIAAKMGDHERLPHDGPWKQWVLPALLGGLGALVAFSSAGAWQGFCPFALPLIGLCGQLGVMSTLVYRSSKTSHDSRYRAPVMNVLRAALGSLLLSCVEVALVQGVRGYLVVRLGGEANLWALLISVAIHFFFGYAMCALSDYMFHRFVWHAHWASAATSVLFRAVRRHYAQHYLAHHNHSADSETSANMAKLDDKPMSDVRKLRIETDKASSMEDVYVMWCSNHGLTVGVENDERVTFASKWGCRLHTGMMYLAMPCGTAALVNAICGSAFGALVHCAFIAFPIYITYHHDKYHAELETRREWVESWHDVSHCSFIKRAFRSVCRSMWLSDEMDRIISDHQKHHHGHEHREEFYGLVPYSRFFVYPVWQSW